MSIRLTDREMLDMLDALADQPLDADELAEMAPIINAMLARYRELLQERVPQPKENAAAKVDRLVRYANVKPATAIRRVARSADNVEAVKKAYYRLLREQPKK